MNAQAIGVAIAPPAVKAPLATPPEETAIEAVTPRFVIDASLMAVVAP